ncbi:MAG: hypothetical protein DDT41_01446 [candidate division WS2 bacterium]|nr:hypothetical protein [Candidatus Psychracetigena formicireducens]
MPNFLTEAELREMFKEGPPEKMVVKPGTVLTPSAQQYIKVMGIELVEESEDIKSPVSPPSNREARFQELDTGAILEQKPEHFTHLKGKVLVPKTHPRIYFRGSLDQLEAFIISAQVVAKEEGRKEFYEWLEEMLKFCGAIFRAEVLEETLPPLTLFGLNPDELRAHSHHPDKHYGVKHFKPSAAQGKLMCALNLVRVMARETELKAMAAFWKAEKGMEREDILLVLNRMSSAAYILMCRLAKNVGVPEIIGLTPPNWTRN